MNPPGGSLESRIRGHILSDGSVIVPPRIARWLEKQADMTADRRIRLRDNDPDAYVVLAALHLAALRSVIGTNDAAPQGVSADLNMWMSTSDAAKVLDVTDRCVRNWCRTGRLRAVLSGSRWLIDRNTVTLKDIV
jgi:excisionase family DNA binding protein